MAANKWRRGDVVSIKQGGRTQIGCVLTDSAYHAAAGVMTYCVVVDDAPLALHAVPVTYSGHAGVALSNLVQTVPLRGTEVRRVGTVSGDVVDAIVGRLIPLLGVGRG